MACTQVLLLPAGTFESASCKAVEAGLSLWQSGGRHWYGMDIHAMHRRGIHQHPPERSGDIQRTQRLLPSSAAERDADRLHLGQSRVRV